MVHMYLNLFNLPPVIEYLVSRNFLKNNSLTIIP